MTISEPQVLSDDCSLIVIGERANSECAELQKRVLEIDVPNLIATVRALSKAVDGAEEHLTLNGLQIMKLQTAYNEAVAVMEKVQEENEELKFDIRDFHQLRDWDEHRLNNLQSQLNEAVAVIERIAEDGLMGYECGELARDFLTKHKEATP